MCVICRFPKGYMPPKDILCNAVNNNPHGYGLIVKTDKNELIVIKDLPKESNDPEVIYKLLEEHKQHERFLHVRWRTMGEVSLENTQPFQVMDKDGHELWFMHNGTLSGYGSYGGTVWRGNQQVQTQGSEASDSKTFAMTVLAKILPKFVGENGVGDIQDKDFQDIILKYWTGNNRGIIISNRLEPFIIGLTHWEIIKTKETKEDGEVIEGEFLASNNDYFNRLSRGPLYELQEREKKRKEEEERAARWSQTKEEKGEGKGVSTVIPFSPGFSERYGLTDDLVDMMADINFYEPEGYCSLANLSYAEMLTFVKKADTGDIASVLMYLTEFLANNAEAFEKLKVKNAKLLAEMARMETALIKTEKGISDVAA